MNTNYSEMTREEVITVLEGYMDVGDILFELISKVKDNKSPTALDELKSKFSSVKEEIKEHYKLLDKGKTKRNHIVDAYFWPAIQDIYTNISGLGVNHITRNSLSKVGSAAYDIRSYARWHRPTKKED